MSLTVSSSLHVYGFGHMGIMCCQESDQCQAAKNLLLLW